MFTLVRSNLPPETNKHTAIKKKNFKGKTFLLFMPEKKISAGIQIYSNKKIQGRSFKPKNRAAWGFCVVALRFWNHDESRFLSPFDVRAQPSSASFANWGAELKRRTRRRGVKKNGSASFDGN